MDKILELLGEIVKDSLKSANCKIEISVKGTEAELSLKGNRAGAIIAANALIVKMSKESGMSYDMLLHAIKGVHQAGQEIIADSREQMDVMEKIIEKYQEER